MEIMKSRKTLQEEKPNDQLVTKEDVKNVEVEQNFCEGSRNQQTTKFLDASNRKGFGFYLSKNVRVKHSGTRMGSTRALNQTATSTFYRTRVNNNELKPFWETLEGLDWSHCNSKGLQQPTQAQINKVLAKKNKNPSEIDRISIMDDSTKNKAPNVVELVPEQESPQKQEYEPEYEDLTETNRRKYDETINRHDQYTKNMFTNREKLSEDIAQRDRFTSELYVIKKSKDFNN